MGQLLGRMPKTWQDLMEERDRILHLSSEVLARVDDNINNEDTFLMDYDSSKIDEKVNQWILEHRIRGNKDVKEFIERSVIYRDKIERGVTEIANKVKNKMRKEYSDVYKDVRKFTSCVDLLGEQQRKIHREIQNLENSCQNNSKNFSKKLEKLRSLVYKNLDASGRISFIEKRLFDDFAKRVYDIDRKQKDKCYEMLEKLIWRF